jgi:hypothetical protein
MKEIIMQKLLGILVVLALVVALVGFYRGWFTVQSQTAGDQTKVEISIDRNRVKADETRVKEGLNELQEKFDSKRSESEQVR